MRVVCTIHTRVCGTHIGRKNSDICSDGSGTRHNREFVMGVCIRRRKHGSFCQRRLNIAECLLLFVRARGGLGFFRTRREWMRIHLRIGNTCCRDGHIRVMRHHDQLSTCERWSMWTSSLTQAEKPNKVFLRYNRVFRLKCKYDEQIIRKTRIFYWPV